MSSTRIIAGLEESQQVQFSRFAALADDSLLIHLQTCCSTFANSLRYYSIPQIKLMTYCYGCISGRWTSTLLPSKVEIRHLTGQTLKTAID